MSETMQTNHSNDTPEFSAGAFEISHFSDSPEGMEFETRKSIGRTEDISDFALNADEKAQLGAAMKREMNFNGVASVNDARDAWRNAVRDGADSRKVGLLKEAFEHARDDYRQKGKKIGLSAVRLSETDANTLSADIKFVPFPVYNLFASPESSEGMQQFSSATGVAMALQTSDGRLVIQHRAVEKQKLHETGKVRGNASYVDIPGASVAGMVDATASRSEERKPGTPDKVDTQFLKNNILKEASEELGLAPGDLDALRIVGLAQDKIKIHDEVLLLADTKLTAEQLHETSRLSNRNKNLGDADFEEKFIDIESSPHAVETLLTEVKCPLPPTHAAALVAAGYSMVVREDGPEAAHAWRERMQASVRSNYEEMDTMTAQFYAQYPEMLEQVPERFWGKRVPPRNQNGYAPAYTPEEQGLPPLEDEMVRVGLRPESRTKVKHGYLFDVDGVVTNPQEKKVTDEALFDEFISRLEAGEPICFNTGRSTIWVMENVITPMRERMQDVSLLQNVVIIGEKGGTWTTFNEAGEAHSDAVETISVPDELKDRVRQLITEKYSDAMFFDESKQTMLSVEMNDGYDLAEFTIRQQEFVRDIETLLRETGTNETYRIDPTTIATDIESPHVSKALGADRFTDFLEYRAIVPEEYTAFGDSGSDAAMADELARRRKKVSLVYVGSDVSSVTPKANYPISHVDGFNRGTLEYLSSAA
jgi:hypothetical protein